MWFDKYIWSLSWVLGRAPKTLGISSVIGVIFVIHKEPLPITPELMLMSATQAGAPIQPQHGADHQKVMKGLEHSALPPSSRKGGGG